MSVLVYYPLTFYHLMLCYIFAAKHGGDLNCIVLDENLFSDVVVKGIADSKYWGRVYRVNKTKDCVNIAQRMLLSKYRCPELFELSGANAIFFSPGCDFCNLWINSIAKNNYIVMAEDGVAPYYFTDFFDGWRSFSGLSTKTSRAKDFIKSKIRNSIYFDPFKINELWISRVDWMSPEIVSQMSIRHVLIDSTSAQSAFVLLKSIFHSEDVLIKEGIDAVYIDHSFETLLTIEQDFNFHKQMLSRLNDRNVLVKLRPSGLNSRNSRYTLFSRLQKESRINIVIDERASNTPWELVYFNNRDILKDAILLSSHFSSAVLSPKLIFDVDHTIYDYYRILCSSIQNLRPPIGIVNLIERINGVSSCMKIYTPNDFSKEII